MRAWRTLNLLLVILVGSCVTVNIYFPAAEVQRAADEIVEDVRSKAQPQTPKQSGWLNEGLQMLLPGPRAAHAANQVNIEVSTPAIRAIKDAMKQRFPLLKPFYDKGAVGENNNGLVEMRDAGALSLQDRAQLAKLIEQENGDRMSLYREIAAANKLAADTVPQIQKIFANSWRNQSQSGWWVQNNNGQWERKR